MPVTVAIPSNLEAFVQQEVATGAVGSEQELVTRALELYREMRQRHAELKAKVDQSLDEAERGEVAPLDIALLKSTLASELSESGGMDCVEPRGG
jgi:Arc/MetJ-type ribon-helix-helix transcriptional regulator